MDESDSELPQPRDELNVESEGQHQQEIEELKTKQSKQPDQVNSSRDELNVMTRSTSVVTNTSIGSNEAKTTNSHVAQDHAKEIEYFTNHLRQIDNSTIPTERESPRRLRLRKRLPIPTSGMQLVVADTSPSHSNPKEDITEILEEVDQSIYKSSSPRYGDDGIFRNTTFTDKVQYSESSFQGLIHRTTHMPHGYGCKKYNNGCELICGQWVNGIPNGVCLYTSANGDKYRGTWMNGTKHGCGILVRHNDAIYKEIYEEGTRISRVTIRKPSKDKMTTPEVSPTNASTLPMVLRKPEVPRFSKRQSAPAVGSKITSPAAGFPDKLICNSKVCSFFF